MPGRCRHYGFGAVSGIENDVQIQVRYLNILSGISDVLSDFVAENIMTITLLAKSQLSHVIVGDNASRGGQYQYSLLWIEKLPHLF